MRMGLFFISDIEKYYPFLLDSDRENTVSLHKISSILTNKKDQNK
jgi:hypothetical protein